MNLDTVTRTASDIVRAERLLPGPIERVWQYLTDPEKRALWLAGGEMELQVGGTVTLRFRHADLSPESGPVPEAFRDLHNNGHVSHGQVTVCEPPSRLAYTWGSSREDMSEVCFELHSEGECVRLVLTHRRLADAQVQSVVGGWHTHLDILQARLENRIPENFWVAYTRIQAAYATRL